MSKVEAYLESDINLDDFDYLVEFGIGLIPELQGKDVTIFASTVIADKIIARNGKFATANGDEPKWQYEGKGLYFLTTPISLIRKTVDGEYKYSLMNSNNGNVLFIPLSDNQNMQAILDQFNILIPFNMDVKNMFSKHTLAAKILKEAKDQGITLAVTKPSEDTEYKYGIDGMSLSNPDKGYEGATTASPVVVPKLKGLYFLTTPISLIRKTVDGEYLNRREQLRKAAEKMARDEEATERALAHFRKFDLEEKGLGAALKYISSMMPRHYEVSTDGIVLDHYLPTRYGMAKRLYIAIEDLKTGFSTTRPVDVIDDVICIPSYTPRYIKGAFEFELKQHLDYELRFKKRDQDRYNTIFTKKENEDV